MQVTEENVRIQAGGELRKKVENIKMINFLVCTATLSFADVNRWHGNWLHMWHVKRQMCLQISVEKLLNEA